MDFDLNTFLREFIGNINDFLFDFIKWLSDFIPGLIR